MRSTWNHHTQLQDMSQRLKKKKTDSAKSRSLLSIERDKSHPFTRNPIAIINYIRVIKSFETAHPTMETPIYFAAIDNLYGRRISTQFRLGDCRRNNAM